MDLTAHYISGQQLIAVDYVTRVQVRIGYTDTHFVKRKPTKMVYPSIRRVSDTDTSPLLEYPWNVGSCSSALEFLHVRYMH
jgi:hypothetical protein